MSTLGILALGLMATWTLLSFIGLLKNYIKARRMGLPIRVIPIDHRNPLWTLLDRKVLSLLRHLPFGNDNNLARYNWRGWELADRYRSHQELGDAFVLVTPGRNWVYLADPDALMTIFRRGAEFPRCIELTEVINVFGPNMSTIEGPRWRTQRKMVNSCFSEYTSEIVWSESIKLASQMLRSWASKPLVTCTAHDTRLLSLLVLSRAGFGKSHDFEGFDDRQPTSPTGSYKNSLQTILENCILIMVLGRKFLAKPWLPSSLRSLHAACESFQGYMTAMYEEEKLAVAEGRSTDRNLMTSLIRASHEETTKSERLTEQEIYGNMFVFNFAGHDTTAHTFTFAIYLLATAPEVQDWLSEEVRQVAGGRQTHEWDYRADFPRLKRCLCILLETLRLYTPVPVAKWTDTETQAFDIKDKTVVLPPCTMLIPSYAAVHTDPKHWGTDSLEWRPSRWIRKAEAALSTSEPEDIVPPHRGTFLGWSEGSRDCPGRKFSQVEFVATIATLFRDWRVDPVTFKGESLADARKRVLKQIETDSGVVLLLQMLHPERSPLVWSRR
ncbi:hypothetical protein HIM_01508 [Hirsutella minnesotensis 3608]|nr:hypothetical protein HIM_01508 [Hirsutella minnesotensis 3608]